jgi:predicted metal-dependent phosphoesterase TrpH
MYRYETHCHTSPVSRCARASVDETVDFYRQLGYEGIFITNHFLDGNINSRARELSYSNQIRYYFYDYERAAEYGASVGLKVFPGVELSYKGTDFLIYGLEKEWYQKHPEILEMTKSEELAFMMDEGALVIQAHPYREAHYIDHIRLFPRVVHGVEVVNSYQSWQSNEMAGLYAEKYGLLRTAGSDNHYGQNVFARLREKGFRPELAGMCSDTEVSSVSDFISKVRAGEMKIFSMTEDGEVSVR